MIDKHILVVVIDFRGSAGSLAPPQDKGGSVLQKRTHWLVLHDNGNSCQCRFDILFC